MARERSATIRHCPTGWNTWDFRGFNRFTYLDRGHTRITVQYGIWDESFQPPGEVKNRGGVRRIFRWTDATRLGPHGALGLPARLDFKAGDTPFRAEAEEKAGALHLTVTPLAETTMRIVFLFVAPDGETVEEGGDARGAFAGCDVRLDRATWPRDYFLNVAEPYALGAPGAAAAVRVRFSGKRAARDARIEAPGTFGKLEAAALSGMGALADAPEAMLSAVTWNTLYDTRRRLVSSPVSRDWCADWKGVIVFCWDTYLAATLVSYAAPELAGLNFEAVTAAIDEMGHVPNYYMAHGAASRDRSMPPVGAHLIWKTQCAKPDKAWLGRMYPRLARWHTFWMRNRDGNGDGLLEWGSNPEPHYEFPQLRQDNPTLQHSAQCSMYEAAVDNSPMYDGAAFNAQTNTFELCDVALSSYYALDCEALGHIAACLGKRAEAAAYREEYGRVCDRINAVLWDEERGIYCNRHWDGRVSSRWSPTSFYPLLAGAAPPERAERIVREHLLNEREFWGRYVIPSITRNDPAYPDNDYWRGRIWGPINFLVAEGLRRYRMDDVAAELARKGLDMFMENWRADGGVYENYNADTGRGGDVWNAARLYHWGGLLALIGMQELVDVEAGGYLRFGSMKAANAGIRNVHVGGATYDVTLDEGVEVRRGGGRFLECSVRAIVRLPLGADKEAPIEVTTAGSGRLRVHAREWAARTARVNGQVVRGTRRAVGTYTW